MEKMSISDFSSLGTLIIAVCAILAPILTALINDLFQIVMKIIDNRQQSKDEQAKHKREVFEKYFHAAGACIHYGTREDYHDFGACSSLAIFYAPENVREKMIHLEQLIDSDSRSDYDDSQESVAELLNEIIIQLRNSQ